MSITPNFNLPTQSMANLIKSADGMKSYDASTGWGGFAEKNSKEYDASFSDTMKLLDEASFNKGPKDGNFSNQERSLLQAQLNWDISPNATNKSANTVQQKTAFNALNALLGIAGIKDVTGDSKFGEADIKQLAGNDGDPSTFSSADIDAHYEKQEAGLTGSKETAKAGSEKTETKGTSEKGGSEKTEAKGSSEKGGSEKSESKEKKS